MDTTDRKGDVIITQGNAADREEGVKKKKA